MTAACAGVQNRTGTSCCIFGQARTRSLTGWMAVRCPCYPALLAQECPPAIAFSDRNGKISKDEAVKRMGEKDADELFKLAGALPSLRLRALTCVRHALTHLRSRSRRRRRADDLGVPERRRVPGGYNDPDFIPADGSETATAFSPSEMARRPDGAHRRNVGRDTGMTERATGMLQCCWPGGDDARKRRERTLACRVGAQTWLC